MAFPYLYKLKELICGKCGCCRAVEFMLVQLHARCVSERV